VQDPIPSFIQDRDDMIRINDIVAALTPLVGWQQDYDPAKAIDESLTQTESGLYYQQAHPLMTLENIRCIMPDSYDVQYPDWNPAVQYGVGAKVRENGTTYEAKLANIAMQPSNSPQAWAVFDATTSYLLWLMQGGIVQTVQTFLQMKSLLKESKNLLERRTFFDGSGRIVNTQPNQGKLVGFELNPVRSMGVTAKIERIGLQMKGATGMVRVYLFHSSQVAPVKWQDFEIKKGNGTFEWFSPTDWYMPYISDGNNAGGSWYVVYNQSDLPDGMEAINVTKDWSREPCMTCNPGDVAGWRELTKYLLISPFKTAALETFEEYPELWDIQDNIYTNTCNYGMNVEVSVGCDLTDFIIRERQMFATVLQRQVAYNALRTMALNLSVRVNRNQSNVSLQNILYELDGNTDGRAGGLGYELKKAYEALDLDTRGLDRICLTCRPIGVRYRTV